MRILVIDDSQMMRLIVTRALRQAGFGDAEITEAADGHEALEAVRDGQPDLILADWYLPGMDGLELLRSLRADGITTTFGFVTAESTPARQAEALEAGASFFVVKPVNPEQIREAISQAPV